MPVSWWGLLHAHSFRPHTLSRPLARLQRFTHLLLIPIEMFQADSSLLLPHSFPRWPRKMRPGNRNPLPALSVSQNIFNHIPLPFYPRVRVCHFIPVKNTSVCFSVTVPQIPSFLWDMSLIIITSAAPPFSLQSHALLAVFLLCISVSYHLSNMFFIHP